MDKDKLDIAYVRTQIHQEDLSSQLKKKDSDSDSQVLAVPRRPQSSYYNQDKSNSRKEENQAKEECYCFKGYGRGHIAKNCSNAKDKYKGVNKKLVKKSKEELASKNGKPSQGKRKGLHVVQEDSSESEDVDGTREEIAFCVAKVKRVKAAPKNLWVLDNGACNHMTAHRNLFVTYESYKDCVFGADGELKVIGKGTDIKVY